jgi:hypothetical protein
MPLYGLVFSTQARHPLVSALIGDVLGLLGLTAAIALCEGNNQ